jgi:uncharacterized repeat protein (TIGR02543 family)
MPQQEFLSGTAVSLNANRFTRTGYKFAGWAASPSGNAIYGDKGAYNLGGQDISLYAKWIPNVNRIIFHDGGGSGTMFDQEMSTGESVALNPNTFIYTGHEFLGWATSQNGGKVYNDGDAYTMGTAPEVHLYAVWNRIANAISFHPNGGTGSMADQSINQGSAANLVLNAFVKPGYSFDGWSTELNGAKAYGDGAQFAMGNAAVTVLYARWKANTNRLVFNANGGSGTMGSQPGATGSKITLLVNRFTRTGYAFAGWSTSAYGDPQNPEYKDAAEYTMPALETNTLYALWAFVTPDPKIEVAGSSNNEKSLSVTGFEEVDEADYIYEWQVRDENGDWMTIDGETGKTIKIPSDADYNDYRVIVTVVDPNGGQHDTGYTGGGSSGGTGGNGGGGDYVDQNGNPIGGGAGNVSSTGTISASQRTIIIVAVIIGVIILIAIIAGVSVSVSREKRRQASNDGYNNW